MSAAPGALRFASFETAAGWCGVAWSPHGIARFRLPEASQRALIAKLRRDAAPGDPPALIADLVARARRYFDGAEANFDDLPLDLDGVAEFQRALYAAIRGLKRGETITYGALAERLGLPKEAARAVGQAMGANPVPLIVPCHRVLAAGGKLGGFSGPGGARQKAEMLALEGVRLNDADPAQDDFGF